jgi:hypothetical protein
MGDASAESAARTDRKMPDVPRNPRQKRGERPTGNGRLETSGPRKRANAQLTPLLAHLPTYYRWRSRSGCTFCFFQQKIEWARLKREHPEAFEEAKRYEKTALAHGSPFTWSGDESLEELERPERIGAIEADYERRLARERARRPANPLREGLEEIDIDTAYGVTEIAASCVICHK